MTSFRKHATKVIVACFFAIVWVCGLSTPQAQAAQTADKVIVSVERQTIGQGYLIEPTVVTFDEFIEYWAEQGVTVAPEDVTVGGVLQYALEKNGTPMAATGGVSGPAYLAAIKNADLGYCNPPQHIKDVCGEIREYDGNTELREKEYTSAAGWVFTEHNWFSNQSIAGHKLHSYGVPYEVAGDSYYVVRLQFSIYYGDTGFEGFGNDGTPSGPWPAADKSKLYAQYAILNDAKFFDRSDEAKAAQTAALSVMENFLAKQAQVDAAYEALVAACHAETPTITQNLPAEIINLGEGAEADPLTIAATVENGELTYEWFSSTDQVTWASVGTGASYAPATDAMGRTYYKCVVTNYDSLTDLTATAESSVATVVVGVDTPRFTTDLSTDPVSYLTVDSADYLEVKAAIDGDGKVTYQWYTSTDKENWEAIAKATGPTCVPDTDIVGTRYYRCRATNTLNGKTSFADSSIAAINTVVDTPVFDENLSTRTSYPGLNGELTFEVKASVKDSGALTYQWYRSSKTVSSGSVEGMELIEGATGSSYDVDTSAYGRCYYYVLATNEVQGEKVSTLSNWTGVSIDAQKVEITKDLSRSTQYVTLGADYVTPLQVEAGLLDGETWETVPCDTLTYQWYSTTDNPGNYARLDDLDPIEGATGKVLELSAETSGSTWYACRVSNTTTDSTGQSVTKYADTRVAKVVVAIKAPAIAEQPEASYAYEVGEAIDPLAVKAEAATEGDVLSYQWYETPYGVDDLEKDFGYFTLIEGATESSYTPAMKMPEQSWVSGYGYVCRVTATRTVDGKEETSHTDTAITRVSFALGAPVFTTDLEEGTLSYDEGDAADTLAVEAVFEGEAEAAVSYQWYCDGNAIEGATGASYTPATDENGLGSHIYHCAATAAYEGFSTSAESAHVTVQVKAAQKTISTEEELRAMKPAGNYLLTADIELTSAWTPVSDFQGIFDGGGHTISGVNISLDTYSTSASFFARAGKGAVIKNLGLTGSVTNTSGPAAGLIGSTTSGGVTVQDCFVVMDVAGSDWESVAGLIGTASDSVVIERCYFRGTLAGGTSSWNSQPGGILAKSAADTSIVDSYTTFDKAVGAYDANTDPTKMVNTYSVTADNYSKAIPGDMDEFLSLLNGGDEVEKPAYAAASEGVNDGYPVLAWQATDEPENPGDGGDTGEPENPGDGEISYEASMASVLAYLQQNVTEPGFGTLSGEWSVLAMARAGVLSEDAKAAWLASLYQKLDECEGVLSETSYTEYSRVIMALSSVGIDPTDVNGYDVLAPLADQDQVGWQGINGTMWALLALDACDYEVPRLPADAADRVQTTREGLISEIIDSQLEDGGWTLWGSTADSDLTAMAIQALAPYYGTDVEVTESVDRALACLSEIQLATGGFGSMSFENPNSTAQVIIALATLDPSLLEDERFVKDGNDMIGRMLDYQLEDGSFTFMLGDYAATNAMITDQAAMALVAYDRALAGENDLFDMTDVNAGEEGEATPEEIAAFRAKVAELPALEDCRIAHRGDVNKLMAELDGLGSFEEKDALRAELQERLDAIDEQIAVVEALDNDIWTKIDPNNVTLDDAETVRVLMRRYEALPVENRRYVEYAEDLIAAKQTILRLEEEQKNQEESSGSNSGASNGGTAGGGGQNSPLNSAGGTFQGGSSVTRKASAKTASKNGDASFEYSVDDNGNVVVEVKEPVITTEMLAFVAGKDQNLVIEFETEMGTCRVTVNGGDLDPEALEAIDLTILFGASNADEIRQLAEDPAIFTFKHAGAFPVPMMFELPVGLADGTYLMLSYNSADKALDYLQKVDVKDGVAKFVVDAGGTYALAKRASTGTLADGAMFSSNGLEFSEHVPLIAAVTTGAIVAVSGAGYAMRKRRRAQNDNVV